ncbi:MAG: phosphoadenylyl-sulfate reductase [Gallionella sp.]|nr:phosphoadenylyl-sulfate reductase [Gallionella sp.]
MSLQPKIEQAVAALQQAERDFAPVCFANSLGAEDMVLTYLIAKLPLPNSLPMPYPQSSPASGRGGEREKQLLIPAGEGANDPLREPLYPIEMFSLDTGRLPQETYDLMQEVRKRYSLPLKIYFPDCALVEAYVAQNGVNGFYDSVELRKRCCYIRKVEPLKRALAGKKAWITGMRRDQAVTRGSLEVSSFDADHGMQKFNPLLDWTNAEVWEYIRQNDVPYNKLHDRFYPSIGCAPCTRAVTPGEDIRSGRWWWENPEGKECGLHVGKVSQLKSS